MTWSQELIAKLTEVEGGPKWKRYPGEGNKYGSPDFATASFARVGADAMRILCEAPDADTGDYQHAQLDLVSLGKTIVVFTDINDAPEGEREES